MFGFSRKETNGFLILIPLMALVVFSRPLYHQLAHRQPENFAAEAHVLDSLVTEWEQQQQAENLQAETTNEPALMQPRFFAFDPNTATFDALCALGFEKETAHRLIRYREKGSTFTRKDDLLKVYGMDTVFFRQLHPYIQLPEESARPTGDGLTKEKTLKESKKPFDINTSDTAQLAGVYGIGPVLSSRIIRYRERLGGFVHRDQLYEVYGLDSTVIDRLFETAFIHSAFAPATIDLNSASEAELASHPYLSKSVAKAIITYRFQHGPFVEVAEVQRIRSLEPHTFLKIEPYLTVKK